MENLKTYKQFLKESVEIQKDANGIYHPIDSNALDTIIEKEIEIQGLNADLNNIDVSKITNMAELFCPDDRPYLKGFNGDISKWDVSNVTSMMNMFANATKFNGNISNWDVSKVTDMNGMFINAKRFNRNLSNWNVSNVQGTYNIFYACPIMEEYKPKFGKNSVKQIYLDNDDTTTSNPILPNAARLAAFGLKDLQNAMDKLNSKYDPLVMIGEDGVDVRDLSENDIIEILIDAEEADEIQIGLSETDKYRGDGMESYLSDILSDLPGTIDIDNQITDNSQNTIISFNRSELNDSNFLKKFTKQMVKALRYMR